MRSWIFVEKLFASLAGSRIFLMVASGRVLKKQRTCDLRCALNEIQQSKMKTNQPTCDLRNVQLLKSEVKSRKSTHNPFSIEWYNYPFKTWNILKCISCTLKKIKNWEKKCYKEGIRFWLMFFYFKKTSLCHQTIYMERKTGKGCFIYYKLFNTVTCNLLDFCSVFFTWLIFLR